MAKKAKKNVKPTNETSEKAKNAEMEKSEEVLTEVKAKETKADKTKAKENKKNKNTAKKKAKNNNNKPKRNFFKEIFSELKKVTWPEFAKVVKQTGIVLGVVLAFLIVVTAFDYGLQALLTLITA